MSCEPCDPLSEPGAFASRCFFSRGPGTFRVPLNLMVVILELTSPSSAVCFLVSTLLLLVALACFAFAHCGIQRREQLSQINAPAKQPLTKPTEASPLVVP